MGPDSSSKLSERIRELERELETLKTFYEKELEANSSKYKRVIDSTSEGYLELDLKLRINDCNAAIQALLGREKDSLVRETLDTLYDKASVFVHFASRNHLSFEARFMTAAEQTVLLLCKRSIIRDSEGNPGGYLVLLTDLTELKKAQDDLQEAQARYRTMYKNAAQGMYQCTLDGYFLRVNPALANTLGFDTTAGLLNYPGGVTQFYKNPDERRILLANLQKKRVVKNFEAEFERPDGITVWALINARLAEDASGKTFIEGILIDNTEKRLAEEKLRMSRKRFRYLANHDNLTKLYNTRYLYKSLDKLIAKGRENGTSFSLVFLDMDNFKRVVDTYGHLNGSQALKEVAKTFKECLKKPAFGVAYGGDEFVLVLPGKGKRGALEQIREIRARMKETTYLEGKGLAVQMSASFGVATYPDDARDREGLLALADEAMFRVKSSGKDAIGTGNGHESG